MPEGPELWALGQASARAGIPNTVVGKHIWAAGKDYHFGLTGRARLADGELAHVPAPDKPYLSGKVDAHDNVGGMVAAHSLGVDWMTGSTVALAAAIAAAALSRQTLGAWMLRQECIAGVGVAWASELCAACALRPDLSCKAQSLRALAGAYVAFREQLMSEYGALVDATPPEEFVAAWPGTLYAARRMAVYQCGTPVVISSRTFWV